MKTLIIMPAYNESKVLADTLDSLLSVLDATVLIVDDGSTDETARITGRYGGSKRVVIVKHIVNLGLGAAIETGLEYARRNGYDVAVTFDADGQHNPKDAIKLISALRDSDLVIGVRHVNRESMPAVKKAGNALLNVLTGLIFGVYSRDSQSGLRAFNRKALEAIRVKANRYEVSSEILFEAKRNGLRISEVEVEAIYTEHSKNRGTGVLDGFKILWRMVIHKMG